MATPSQPGLDLSQLDGAVQFFCSKEIAPTTHRTYQSGFKRLANFCSLYNILTPFPVSESILCYFTTYLASQKLAPQSIKTYLAAIRYMQITLGLPEPKEFSSLPRLRLLQAGIKRVHATAEATRIRLPITPKILQQIHQLWSPAAEQPDIIMLWAAASMCFFGFFRAGEITLPSQNAFEPGKHLSWGDITVDSTQAPSMIKIRLKQSITDQLRQGVDVFIGKTGCRLCPVAAVLRYMVARGSQPGPFFRFQDKTPLTKANFTSKIREVLNAIGLPQQDFAGHSFRIGAATAAVRAGLEDSTIRMLGRWSSSAFLTYIWTPREQLATLSTTMARV